MKKNLFLLLLAALLAFMLSAAAEVTLPGSLTDIEASAFEGDTSLKGRVTLPASVKTVGSRAFANTGLHALALPAGCTSVDGSVLANTSAAYLYLNGSSTAINGDLVGPVYVFGPSFGSASSLDNFYATETLAVKNGFYYSVMDGHAVPLCAVDGTAVSTDLIIPKLVNGQPVRSLDTLVVNGCSKLSAILAPSYLTLLDSLEITFYPTMTAAIPQPSQEEADAGDVVTWETSITGDYGEVTYLWSFELDGSIETIVTAEPYLDYTMRNAGNYNVTVEAIDEVGDSASATAENFQVNGQAPVYRALLIGNTYPGAYNELFGCLNDVAGMKSMLERMYTTDYRISTASNLSAGEMTSTIYRTFNGATVNDVSLFYFAGHGVNAVGTSYHGALVGTNDTYLSIPELKNVLDGIPGKKIVILDSCHSGQSIGRSAGTMTGASATELKVFNSKVVTAFASQTKGANDLANSGYYVITAAHSSEECITMGYDAENDGVIDKHFGLFTYALTQGSGWNMATNVTRSMSADSNNDGAITLYEAYSYARYTALDSNPNQTAQAYPDNSSMIIWAK